MRSVSLLAISMSALVLAGCATSGEGRPKNREEVGTLSFPMRSLAVSSERFPQIGVLVERLNATPGSSAYIVGHAYDHDSRSQNMGMAKRRADAVAAYMVELGVDESRVRTDSRGESDPHINMNNMRDRDRYNRAVLYYVPPITE